MRYYAEIITLSEVKIYAVEKKDVVVWCNQHPGALCIDEEFYFALLKPQK